MEDIVERLRGLRYVHVPVASNLMAEAASSIETLRWQLTVRENIIGRLVAENERLRDCDGWISVADQMPTPGERALFFVHRRNTGYAAVYAGEYLAAFDVWAYDLANEKGWSAFFVTHWMPAPKPPKE